MAEKWGTIKTIAIIVLIGVILFLLFSNNLNPDTKTKFFWFAFGLIVVGTIMYFLFRKKRLTMFEVGKIILHEEFVNTGRRININDMACDKIDSETLLFSFESAGNLISYKWNFVNDMLYGRLCKKMDAIKDEVNRLEITRTEALKVINESTRLKQMSEQKGFDVANRGETE